MTDTTTIDPRIVDELTKARDARAAAGRLLSPERLEACYAAFRDRFAPERLKALDGAALLDVMHAHGNKQSLVYWLEFKNDEEFPGPQFGSISGGSAHKFRIFRRADSQQWVKGSAQKAANITEAEAVDIARQHRDQLTAGAALLDGMPVGTTSDATYEALQREMEVAAPDLHHMAWAHKYLSLLYPHKLDDYNNKRWQRFHLTRILQAPPPVDGLYSCAGAFVRLAARLGWPINHVTAALNERNGEPVTYWRVGTEIGADGSLWPDMRDGGFAAIGWERLGDISVLAAEEDQKAAIRARLAEHYYRKPVEAAVLTRKAGEIRDFAFRMEEGDVVLAADGERVLGVGRVTGPYQFAPAPADASPAARGAPHHRPVQWVSTEEWKLPVAEGLRTTVYALKKIVENALAIERRLFEGANSPVARPKLLPARHRFEGIVGRVESILERKGQAILFGPPGTGKTY